MKSTITLCIYPIQNLPATAIGIWAYLASVPTELRSSSDQVRRAIGLSLGVYRKNIAILRESNLIEYYKKRAIGRNGNPGGYAGIEIIAKDGSEFIPSWKPKTKNGDLE